MDHSQQLDVIRRAVQAKFTEYGANADCGCTETILVRESHYCGRKFGCDGWRAVWFVEEKVVKFFDVNGGFRESLDLAELPANWRDHSERAA